MRGGAKSAAQRKPPADKVTAAEQQELESATMLLRQGDYAVSVQKLQDFLRRHPQDELANRTLRDAYAGLAKQQLDEGKTDDALGYVEQAEQIKQPGTNAALQSVRKDLAQDYYEKAIRVQRSDLPEAIRLWELAVKYDPDHVQARLRLERAKRMQRNLDAIEDANGSKAAKPKQ